MASILAELNAASTLEDKAWMCARISRLEKSVIQQAAQSHDLVLALANVLKENKEHWADRVPDWLSPITNHIFSLREVIFQNTSNLVDVLIEYFAAHQRAPIIECLWQILFNKCKLDFLNHEPLFTLFSENENVRYYGRCAFTSATDNCDEWQLKVMQDKPLVLQLLSAGAWFALVNLAQHPDAKVLLPSEVFEKACTSEDISCKRICAILSNESDAYSLKLDTKFIENQTATLKTLLDQQTKQGVFGDNLIDISLPFVNLSVSDANKEFIGEKLISLLLRIITIKESKELTGLISFCLARGRQEAAKTLWNLAFAESNRKRIETEGVAILEKIKNETQDEVLKKYVTGVLFMLGKANEPASTSNLDHSSVPTGKKGHVMISYNWSHQHIAARLAKSLKARGFSVWLDINQMKGSTLGAMAEAIEGADMVLMCVSQKYKDSPNCRLEGEYCVNRKIPFIPLIVQSGYRADGWLGLVMGSKLWYNFADEADWESKMSALAKEIGEHGAHAAHPAQEASPRNSHGTKDWTTEEVASWLETEKLSQLKETFVKHEINGVCLLELKSMLQTHPRVYLHYLKKMKMNSMPVGVQLMLSSALKKL